MTEEHYQDGIKLRTDNDISTWKEKVGANVTFARAKIEGGYLYYLLEGDGVCFVPDNNMQNHINNSDDMLKHIADLSIKLNKMQDSLREFEKEKVEPIKKRLDEMHSYLKDISIDEEFHFINKRIQKLEEHHTRQIDENRKVFNHLDHHDYSKNKIVERIEKLESALKPEFKVTEHVTTTQGHPWINEKQECQHGIILYGNRCLNCERESESHPRDEVKFCQHGNPMGIICTACY